MGMRDEHSLLHIHCIGLDTTGGMGIEHKIKVNNGMNIVRLFICRTYEATHHRAVILSYVIHGWMGWGVVGMAGVDLGFCAMRYWILISMPSSLVVYRETKERPFSLTDPSRVRVDFQFRT